MEYPWWSIVPFVAMLLCIAILPLIPATGHLWENWKFQLGIALVLGVPTALWVGLTRTQGWTVVGHSVFEYIQFISLLFALFVVSGGIFLSGDIAASPRNNSLFLIFGGVIASFIGTTGAAMLLIRPILNTNKQRKHKAHTVMFTIFMVANCGGLLTPLGDPPLFMGLLRGVPFTWTFNLFPEWLFVNAMLLATYYSLDRIMYQKEEIPSLMSDVMEQKKLGLHGKFNLVWLAAIIAGVAFAPSLDLHAIEDGSALWNQYVPWREIVLLGSAFMSFVFGSKKARFELNKFTWGPIVEVAVLFWGIFLTMIPALKFLAQVAPKLPLNEISYFTLSGALSSVLDNAPTYATFFEIARANAAASGEFPADQLVAGVPEVYLVAISLGSVFCGAVTYIGNGPNFMVKAVAESAGVKMPAFGGYIVWAFRYLVPILFAMACIFIAHPLWAKVLGIVVALLLLGRDAWNIAKAKKLEAVAAE
ncbi:MAG: sodium:proton antiporter [Actinomycetaceae bacterium]|nr:sodium:proton antiporter [Actinomycetaceae bacterium]